MARLFLVSDILHNSSAPVRNASAYRTHFAGRLPDVFESVADAHKALVSLSRISSEAMKAHVLAVLRCWADRFIFADAYLAGLQGTFLRGRACDENAPPAHPLRAELAQLGLDVRARRGATITRWCHAAASGVGLRFLNLARLHTAPPPHAGA